MPRSVESAPHKRGPGEDEEKAHPVAGARRTTLRDVVKACREYATQSRQRRAVVTGPSLHQVSITQRAEATPKRRGLLIATQQAVTGDPQVEFGFSVNRGADGALFTSEVSTLQEPDHVEIPILNVGSPSGNTLNTFHTHISGGTGRTYTRRDGTIFTPKDQTQPSPQDVKTVIQSGQAGYVIVASEKLLFRINAVKGTGMPVLTDKDFGEWLKRAKEAKEAADKAEKK